MFEGLGVVLLASRSYGGLGGSYTGGALGDFLNQAANAGLFSYLLPFLLLFAIIFGVLETANIFKDNKAVNGIIALSVSLLSLQFELVPLVYQEIFPRLGVGLAFLLVIIILLGIFIPKHKSMVWTFAGIVSVIAIIIFIQTAGSLGWSSSLWWFDNWPTVAVAIAILVLVGVIVGGSKPENKDDINSKFFNNLFGGKN